MIHVPVLTGAGLTVAIAIIETLGELIKFLVMHVLMLTGIERAVSVATIKILGEPPYTASDTYASVGQIQK